MKYPLSQPWITALERDYVHRAIDDGWISGSGPQVAQLEHALSQRFERHAIACANGTLAIEAVLRALKIGHGDEVLCPALTFVAPAAAIRAVGATPVFTDIDPTSWTIQPEAVRDKQTERTRALIAVDVLGHPCDYTGLRAALRDGVLMIEDAAEAHGARFGETECGRFAVASTFSLHPNKAVTAGEGGFVLVSYRYLAEAVRLHVHHGMTPERPYVHDIVGSNYRLSNLNAALALAQVERWDELTAARRQVSDWYDKYLPEELGRRPVAAWATEGVWLVTVTHPRRDELLASVRARGIDARAIWPIIPSNLPYLDLDTYPIAERVSKIALWLPTYATMTEEDVRAIARAFEDALVRRAS